MNTIADKLLTFLIILLITTIFVPLFRIETECLFLAAIILVCIFSNPDILRERSLIFAVLFVVVQFIWAFFGVGITSYNSIIVTSLYIITSIAICGCFDKFSKKQINLIAVFTILIFLISCVSTFLSLLSNPLLLREYGYDMSSSGISSFQLVFSYGVGEGLAIVLPAFLSYGLFAQKPLIKIFTILIVVLGIATQLIGTLTTSAILSLFFCAVVIISFLSSIKKVGLFKVLLPIALIICVFATILPDYSIQENLTLMTKMEDVQSSISSDGPVGQVESRVELYKQSLRVCLNNPILGLGKVPETFGVYGKDMVSLHTTILDYYGMYGLFTLLLFFAWKKTIQFSFSMLNKMRRKHYQWYLYSLILLLLLKGPVTVDINFLFSTFIVGILIRSELINV